MEKSEFLAKLAIAEARVHTGVPPITKIPMDPNFLGEFGTRSTVAAWRHAHDLGIFVGEDNTHQLNPIIMAICETRSGASVYQQMAFAEEAWKYYQEHLGDKSEEEVAPLEGLPVRAKGWFERQAKRAEADYALLPPWRKTKKRTD